MTAAAIYFTAPGQRQWVCNSLTWRITLHVFGEEISINLIPKKKKKPVIEPDWTTYSRSGYKKGSEREEGKK